MEIVFFMVKFKKKAREGPKLWTKDFSILTIGSLVSMAGARALTISLGLLILDLTQSQMYYSIFLAIGNAVGILVPFLIAARLECWSKEKVIYRLDFATAVVMFGMVLIYEAGWMSGEIALLCCICFSLFNKIYDVAFQSFFPKIVDKAVYPKAYSVSSVVTNIADAAEMMGTLGYKIFGITPVLLFCGTAFFIAACFETRLSPEQGLAPKPKQHQFRQTIDDYRNTLRYIKKEQGLVEMLVYQFFDSIRIGAFSALVLPFFKFSEFSFNPFNWDGEYIYVLAMSFYSTGQFWGCMINYQNVRRTGRLKLFTVAAVFEILPMALFSFFPLYVGVVAMFITGLLSIVTNCAKRTVIYERIPPDMVSKYTGCSCSLLACGAILGNLAAGALASAMPAQAAFLITCSPVLIIYLIMLLTRIKQLRELFSPIVGGWQKTTEE